MVLVSIIIRTLNEAKYLGELLTSIQKQHCEHFEVEVVIIDSGSNDETLEIATRYECRITKIEKKDFTFGKSLNMGSSFSRGSILVYISGHCVPESRYWLSNLINPILTRRAGYSYGRQIGRDTTKYSESKIFDKYFPERSKFKQSGFFCNNANAAISREVWESYLFNETITGLEDMELGKRYCESGASIAYVAEACVYHIHDETWTQTRRRYEREAIALRHIMPDVSISVRDMIRYIVASICSDSVSAFNDHKFITEFLSIVKFRTAQFLGSYRGNHEYRELTNKRRENYFYPTKKLQD